MRVIQHPILHFQRGREIKFTFNGRELTGYEGETIAAALHASGVRALGHSPRLNRPRGFFCATGNCSSCLMKVNGIANVRVCITPLQEGAVVEVQKGKGDILATD
ncbi:MAG: (2Fe-2S)-binding protein [Bacillota bacterium]